MPNKRVLRPVESSAAAVVGGNVDLALEILVRLPAKSVVRSKLVSKQWFSLLSDSQFARTHALRQNPTNFAPSGIYFYNSPDIKCFSLRKINPNELTTSHAGVPSLAFLDDVIAGASVEIVQSCNGLLLCCLSSRSDGSSKSVENFCVCNPATKQYALLPKPQRPKWNSASVHLVFDPSISADYKVISVMRSVVDFPNGYDARADVVRYGPYGDSGCYQIYIYSFEEQSWRPLSCLFIPPDYIKFGRGVLSNGAIHWFCEGFYSLSFDVNAGNLVKIPMPRDRGGGCRYFGECGGHLHYIKICDPYQAKLRVLGMNRDHSKWVIKYQVSLSRLASVFPEIVSRSTVGKRLRWYVFFIICVVRGLKEEDSELVLVLVLTIPGKVISYNFVKKTVKTLGELPEQVVESLQFGSVRAYPYAETLCFG